VVRRASALSPRLAGVGGDRGAVAGVGRRHGPSSTLRETTRLPTNCSHTLALRRIWSARTPNWS
jgi:hypothetical protein